MKNSFYSNKEHLLLSLIDKNHIVLDVGFWGQGTDIDNPKWVHNILKTRARGVYGVDLSFSIDRLEPQHNYLMASAEDFNFDLDFDIIFAGDLIEHLSNPGLFLNACRRHLKPNGKLIITTPNCFNFFNLTEKISKYEPTTNSDHTCYFNIRTLRQLLAKNNWRLVDFNYIYSLDTKYKPSWKKKILDFIYKILSLFTDKYLETIVVIAERD
jgi:SAM-dependent methyltransferase